MSLLGLPETDPVGRRIRAAATRNTLSHALLITGGGDRLAAAVYAAAGMECVASGEKPCGVCEGCRKVLENIHPDVTVVRDPDHKFIAVEVVRGLRADVHIRPNEGRRKIYIFPDCALLTEQDQNVLLKTVEEGPPYAAFLFCAENPSQVLQTLRSRCAELRTAAQGSAAGETPEAAEVLCRAVASKKRAAVTEAAIRLERKKISREDLAAVLEESRSLFAGALLRLYGQESAGGDREITAFLAKNLTKVQMMHTIELLQKYRDECVYNVGVGHVLGALAVELEGILD